MVQFALTSTPLAGSGIHLDGFLNPFAVVSLEAINVPGIGEQHGQSHDDLANIDPGFSVES